MLSFEEQAGASPCRCVDGNGLGTPTHPGSGRTGRAAGCVSAASAAHFRAHSATWWPHTHTHRPSCHSPDCPCPLRNEARPRTPDPNATSHAPPRWHVLPMGRISSFPPQRRRGLGQSILFRRGNAPFRRVNQDDMPGRPRVVGRCPSSGTEGAPSRRTGAQVARCSRPASCPHGHLPAGRLLLLVPVGLGAGWSLPRRGFLSLAGPPGFARKGHPPEDTLRAAPSL